MLKEKHPKKFKGKVVSSSMQKTVVVKVSRLKKHLKYERRYRVDKKYHAHTQEPLKVGTEVIIEECRPISKTKKWKVVRALK